MSFSDTLENEILDHVFRNAAYVAPTTCYIALTTTDSTDSALGTEVTGGSYARQAVTFSAASGGAISNSATIEWPAATAGWGTVVGVAIMSASTGGTMLAYAGLAADKTIATGDVFRIPAGDLDITLN